MISRPCFERSSRSNQRLRSVGITHRKLSTSVNILKVEPLPIYGPRCWAFSTRLRQGGPSAADRITSSIGTLLPIALVNSVSGDDDKPLDAATSCREPTLAITDSFGLACLSRAERNSFVDFREIAARHQFSQGRRMKSMSLLVSMSRPSAEDRPRVTCWCRRTQARLLGRVSLEWPAACRCPEFLMPL